MATPEPHVLKSSARPAALMIMLLTAAVAQGQQWQSNGTHIYNTNSGNVGVGTQSPTEKVHVAVGNLRLPTANGGADGNIYFGGITHLGQPGLRLFGGLVNGYIPAAFIDVMTTDPTDGLRFRVDTQAGGIERMRIAANGVVSVYGDLAVGGNIAAKYQDIAEWVSAARPVRPGVVVSLDPSGTNRVIPSQRSYDTRIAGVVTSAPGLVLGETGEGKVMVATFGRVKVRADATSAPIHVGDLLVSSNREGTAMRSDPVTVNGVPLHRPGSLLGKALENLEAGEGEILVLLSLQ